MRYRVPHRSAATQAGLTPVLGVMQSELATPQLYFDANNQLASFVFGLVTGTKNDLAKMGLTPQSALGRQFLFVQEDEGPNGEPDAIQFLGTIDHSEKFGYHLRVGGGGVHWRSDIEHSDA